MKIKCMILILFFVWWCDVGARSKPQFKLNIGLEGAYVYSLEYANAFGTVSTMGMFSKVSVSPSLDIGLQFNPRFSLLLHYSHIMILSNRSYETFHQLPYLGITAIVTPSAKHNNFYVSYSVGIQFLGSGRETPGTSFYGLGTTVAFGYRVNNQFGLQFNVDGLWYAASTHIDRTTIDQNDLSNTIRNDESVSFGMNWYNVMFGVSAIWDIL
jgi:hypothetical protein